MYPRITVVTPSYNQSPFIEATIRSILDQEYPNLEYIIVDGGSTDRSVDIINRYQKHLALCVSEGDTGPADALTKGFGHATGSILAYLNSDDLYLPGTLHHVAKAFQGGYADVVYGNTYWIDGEGRLLGERRQTALDRLGYLYGGYDLQQPATFWTREIYEKSGGIDPTYHFAFDMDLFCRFALQRARFRHINQFLASFRIHDKAKSSTQIDLCRTELARLRSAHLSFPFDSFRARCIRSLARVQRTFRYTMQGDLLWLLGRIPDRVRAHRTTEIAGPRAHRM
jgi:glycosyltransferase involved in cell wall biosynthesis